MQDDERRVVGGHLTHRGCCTAGEVMKVGAEKACPDLAPTQQKHSSRSKSEITLPILNILFLPCSLTRASCSNGAHDSWISGYATPPPPGVFVFPTTGDDASDEDDKEEDACWQAEDDGCWRSGAS